MALEVLEQQYRTPELLLLGIRENGFTIARMLGDYLATDYQGNLQVGSIVMDKRHPADIRMEPPIPLEGKVVILIDDVANSGRTMLYALKALLDEYPVAIQTLALVERTHKSFPVALDYVGLSLSTTPDQHIYVEVAADEITGAWMDEE